jgi:hypothetical protein
MSVCPQNLPKVFFGKGYKAKLLGYLGNGTFGRFLLTRASAKLRHCPEKVYLDIATHEPYS